MDSDCIEVVEMKENFKSLVASRDIAKGTFLADLTGPVLVKATMYTYQVAIDKHVDPEGKFRFSNHSCSPNAQIVFRQRANNPIMNAEQTPPWYLMAKHDISRGEQICWDYTLSEYSMAGQFQCECGSEDCLGVVRGFKYLPLKEKTKRLANASPVIEELFAKEKKEFNY